MAGAVPVVVAALAAPGASLVDSVPRMPLPVPIEPAEAAEDDGADGGAALEPPFGVTPGGGVSTGAEDGDDPGCSSAFRRISVSLDCLSSRPLSWLMVFCSCSIAPLSCRISYLSSSSRY